MMITGIFPLYFFLGPQLVEWKFDPFFSLFPYYLYETFFDYRDSSGYS